MSPLLTRPPERKVLDLSSISTARDPIKRHGSTSERNWDNAQRWPSNMYHQPPHLSCLPRARHASVTILPDSKVHTRPCKPHKALQQLAVLGVPKGKAGIDRRRRVCERLPPIPGSPPLLSCSDSPPPPVPQGTPPALPRGRMCHRLPLSAPTLPSRAMENPKAKINHVLVRECASCWATLFCPPLCT